VEFHFTEARMLQVRADSFNVPNTTHFGLPGAGVGNPTFMTIQSASTARQIQVSMKFLW
jgi:hypothetical protein